MLVRKGCITTHSLTTLFQHVTGSDKFEETAGYVSEIVWGSTFLISLAELQQQYTTYKNTLQQLAQRIGEIEQDTEEHK